ncbi:MAG: hypothetical protein IT380_05940 [Myxococcales bacterium]|nr:hypothetical protein [Myxococcales bacterium]
MRACVFLLLLAGCTTAPCPIDLYDAGCPPPPADCADAAEAQPCSPAGKRCALCVPHTFHSYGLSCAVTLDGGARWVLERGIPPAECRD